MPYLDPDQKEKLLERLRPKLRGCPCSPYGARLEVGDLAAAPVLERGVPSGVATGNQFVPMIPVICKNCGQIQWYSAIGLVDLNG